jgi:hypothetical protein
MMTGSHTPSTPRGPIGYTEGMPQPLAAEAVLVTGVYGAGKSSLVADMGTLLEERGVPYGVLDVDWLGWFDVGADPADQLQVTLGNVHTICRRYLEFGVRRLAMAWSVRDRTVLDALREAVPAPLRVIRLDVDAAVIEQRLRADPTVGRQDDLRVAQEWMAGGHGVGLEDLLVPGNRPIRQTAETVCSWLGWL